MNLKVQAAATDKISADIKAGRAGSVSKEDLEIPIFTA
jgi:hypothetical protein